MSIAVGIEMLEFEMDGLPPMNTANGWHWRRRKKAKDEWINKVYYAARNAIPVEFRQEPLSRAKVTLIRCSTREPDFDNLVQGGKFIMDGLVKAGVILDDKPSVIGQPVYLWQKASPKQGKVRVRVEAVECLS
jgi:Holliday junction resolvase RusA-like endonuclease